MTDQLLSIAAIAGVPIGFGCAAAILFGGRIESKWLALSVALILLNDFCLFRGYGTIPKLFASNWNWEGKMLALAVTLGAISVLVRDKHEVGLTLRQRNEGRLLTSIVFFAGLIGIAFWAGSGEASPIDPDAIAFQLTMPGLEEELFFRGLLLYTLDRALIVPQRLPIIQFSLGAVVSTLIFGLAHALYYSAPAGWAFALEPFLVSSGLGALLMWLRLRTGSLIAPIILHNLGNTMPFLLAGRLVWR